MIKRWGWMLTLLKGKHFKVKLLYFREGGEISNQRHKHRWETWLFIFGKGKFSQSIVEKREGRQHLLGFINTGDVIHVNKNEWHQYKADKPTLVLEIQTGKCSERDIERA